MLARVGKLCTIVVLVTMLGAHWATLQTVAWTTMLAGNLRAHSFSEAMADTFDGRHPCCLCKAIAAAKRSEKKNAATSSAQRFEFLPARQTFVFYAPDHARFAPLPGLSLDSLRLKPPVPPPRLARA